MKEGARVVIHSAHPDPLSRALEALRPMGEVSKVVTGLAPAASGRMD